LLALGAIISAFSLRKNKMLPEFSSSQQVKSDPVVA